MKYHRISLFSLVMLLVTLCLFLAGCTVFQGIVVNQNLTPQPHSVVLTRCQSRLSSSLTGVSSAPSQRVLYFGSSSGNLYAVNAHSGVMLWCTHVQLTGSFPCPHSCPAPPQMIVGTPTVVQNTVYVCASGYSGYTYAFRASNGAFLWRTKTDCAIDSIPFSDYAVPLVSQNVVYSGLYALRAQNGSVLWHFSVNASFQALVNGVLYGNSEDTIYAISAKDGSFRWSYTAKTRAPIGGPLAVAQNRVYYGTLGSVENPSESAFYVLDAHNGTLLWQHAMGDFSSATVAQNVVYVGSRDQYLYAFDATNGTLRWRYKSVYPVYSIPTIGSNGAIYINMDGAYALGARQGNVLWHVPLGSSQSVDFTPSVVADGVVYLASNDGSGQSILYALNASNGSEYWHTAGIQQMTPAIVA